MTNWRKTKISQNTRKTTDLVITSIKNNVRKLTLKNKTSFFMMRKEKSTKKEKQFSGLLSTFLSTKGNNAQFCGAFHFAKAGRSVSISSSVVERTFFATTWRFFGSFTSLVHRKLWKKVIYREEISEWEKKREKRRSGKNTEVFFVEVSVDCKIRFWGIRWKLKE